LRQSRHRCRLPGAAGIDHPVITGAGHFLQEDAGERLGTFIASFIRSHPHAADRPRAPGQRDHNRLAA
jgi:haloalkane dehalogenase